MSIKSKIALYNTFFMGIMVIILLFFMEGISTSVVESSAKNQVKFFVEENADEVEWDDGELELDDVEFSNNDVKIMIYSEKGVYLAGQIVGVEDIAIPFRDGEYTVVSLKEDDYIIYDYLVESRKHENVYVRGIVSIKEANDLLHSMVYFTLCALPLFVLCVGAGSYIISKKMMKPLEKMIVTAEEITQGKDLSRRIDLGKGNDELHQLSETFDIMFSRLEQAFLAEKQFTSDVSHELRTPTAVILAECEYSLNQAKVQGEEREALELIQRQGKKMQTLISALLNFIRLDNGIHKPDFEEVDLSELIALVCEEQDGLVPNCGELKTVLPDKLMYSLDYGMMIRVLSNLIENGFKYGKECGSVTVSLIEKEDIVLIVVEDDGIGIEQEHLEKIFHRFYQVDPARTQSSMGLGLAMVEQMVKCHGGKIFVESEVGVGTRFSVELPKKSEKKVLS